MKNKQINLINYYSILHKHFGHLNWWPGDTVDEIIIGAVLTQNTNWTNVEKAIHNLKNASMLDLMIISNSKKEIIAKLIRPSGYYNIKTERLKSVAGYFSKHKKDNYKYFFESPVSVLRDELLNVKGIGRETADSILLYAFEQPVFVIDAYTLRMCKRHKLLPEKAGYQDAQAFFMESIKKDTKLYNDFHAQIVMLGKNYCKPKPDCSNCPLKEFMP